MSKAAERLSSLTTPEKTVAEIADGLGVTRQTVWLWASGKGRPAYAQMLRLRDDFGIALEDWEGDK